MKYGIAWNADKRTLTLVDADTDSTKTNEVISQLVHFNLGEIPDSSTHPAPLAHLKNLALQQGYDDFRRVTVVNKTGNADFDKLEQKADEELEELIRIEREGKRVENTGNEGVYGDVERDKRAAEKAATDETETVTPTADTKKTTKADK